MADLTITATHVLPGNGANIQRALAGVAITAGQSIYLDTTGLAQLAKADSSIHAACAGVAACNAGAGQPVNYYQSGLVNFTDSILTVGQQYAVSAATAGDIAPVSDLTTGNYTTYLGYAVTTAQLSLSITVTGLAHG